MLTGGVVSGVVLGAGAIGTKVATKLGAVDNRPGARAEGEKQSVRSPQQAMAIGWR